MRSLGGFALLAGIGVGLFVYLPTPVHRTASLENAQKLWAQASRPSAPSAPTVSTRSFSPQISLANVKPTGPDRAERPAVNAVKDIPAAVTTQATAPAQPTTVSGWQPVVTNTAGRIWSGTSKSSLKPNSPTSRYKLVVEIQRKLKKRGCYWGRIDGSWGAGTKYAMQAFVDRINAALPIEQPDYLLLTLLQTNSDRSCGECPSGQTVTVGGSCVPQTTVADTRRKTGNRGQNVTEVLPWNRPGAPQPAAQPLLRPVGTTIVTTAPLPGGMAIGGPMQLPPPAAGYGNQPSSTAAIATEESNDTSLSPPVYSRPRAARPARATRRAAKRSRKRSRGVRAARRRNLMLSLGGTY